MDLSNAGSFGGSVWGGPQQFTAEPLLNDQRVFAYRASRVWYTERSPILGVPLATSQQVEGSGLVGLAVDPGQWVVTDEVGRSKILQVPPLPECLVVVLKAEPPTLDSMGVLEQPDEHLTSATLGGAGVPCFQAARAVNGTVRFANVPPGRHLLVRRGPAVVHNLVFVAYDQDSEYLISLTLRRLETRYPEATSTADVVVEVAGSPVVVESVDAVAGRVTLAAVPDSSPTCTYWAMLADVFG